MYFGSISVLLCSSIRTDQCRLAKTEVSGISDLLFAAFSLSWIGQGIVELEGYSVLPHCTD